MNKAWTAAVLVLVVFTARDAAAQPGGAWTDYGYFNINVGFESKSGELSGARTFTLYDEPATLSLSQPTDSGALFDFSVGARVWRNVSVGIGFHQGSTSGDAHVTGSVPHPLFFNRNRAVDATISDLERRERAIHLQFGYMFLVNDKLGVHFLAGPSFFKLHQDTVTDISVREQGSPFTSVALTTAAGEAEDSATGFNIGADVSYVVYQTSSAKVGVGAFVRYAGASTKVSVRTVFQGVPQPEVEFDSDSGGGQFGIGARFRW